MSQAHLDESMVKMVNKVFNNNQKLPYHKLIEMRNELFSEILESEFNSFNHVKKDSKNYITNESFAKSIISFLSYDKASSYIKHLDSL